VINLNGGIEMIQLGQEICFLMFAVRMLTIQQLSGVFF